jgi:hypothetical protein
MWKYSSLAFATALAIPAATQADTPIQEPHITDVGREYELPYCDGTVAPVNYRCTAWQPGVCTLTPQPGEQASAHYQIKPRSFSYIPNDHFDWGGGNVAYDRPVAHCRPADPANSFLVSSTTWRGTGQKILAHVTGYIDHIEPATLRGTLRLGINGCPGTASNGWTCTPALGDVEIALQKFDGQRYVDIAIASVAPSWTQTTHELQAAVEPGSDVRFEVRARNHEHGRFDYALQTVRLFGAQCYPDFNNPGECLE